MLAFHAGLICAPTHAMKVTSATPAVDQAPATGTTVATQIDDSVLIARAKSALIEDHSAKSLDIKAEVRIAHGVEDAQNIDNRMSIKRSCGVEAFPGRPVMVYCRAGAGLMRRRACL